MQNGPEKGSRGALKQVPAVWNGQTQDKQVTNKVVADQSKIPRVSVEGNRTLFGSLVQQPFGKKLGLDIQKKKKKKDYICYCKSNFMQKSDN